MGVMSQIIKGMALRLGSEEAVLRAIFKEITLYDSRFAPEDKNTIKIIQDTLKDEIVNIQSERYDHGKRS